MKVIVPRVPKVMTRIAVTAFILILVLFGVYSFLPPAGAHALSVSPPVRHDSNVRRSSVPVALASPGRIEGRSDLVNVGAAMDGVIEKIFVKEGQRVRQGDILAELECNDLRSALQVAQAKRDSLKESRARLVRGSRDEERQAAAQKTAATRAVLAQASSQSVRMTKLFEAQEVSKLTYEEARRDEEVAQAQFQQAQKNEELVNAGPLPEDLARADADLNAAEAGIKLAEDNVNKCVIRAPITGSILRVQLREGESFALLSPRPLFSMADLSGRRVRAEVDEDDIGHVYVGQRLLISADAYSQRSFQGVVTQLAPIMGRKSITTGDPAQKADRDVLEVTADLEPKANALPIGLRVTVQFAR
jgi:HlyD family secretion protein